MLNRVPWDEFIESWDWSTGEHVCIIGPSGSGKSTLQRSLLWERDWVVVLCTKKRDNTYTKYLQEGYTRSEKWPAPLPPRNQKSQHVLLWPKIRTISDLYNVVPPVHKHCLDDVFVDENWALGLDDLYYLCKVCNLTPEISALNYQVRAMGVTMVCCMQRPAWVPRSAWDQASHAFVRRMSDVEDIRTIRGLSPWSAREFDQQLRQLKRYEWLYIPVAHGDEMEPVIVKPPI